MSDFIQSIVSGNVDGLSNALNLYKISGSELDTLNNYLWQDSPNFWDSLNGIVENALNCIVSLHVIPNIPENDGETLRLVRLGNKHVDGLSIPNIKRFAIYDSDNLVIEPYFDTSLDYDPYTKVKIYLPFSGFHQLKAVDVIGQTVKLSWGIDFLTGDILYCVEIGTDPIINEYYFKGNCKMDIPLTGANYSRGIQSLFGLASSATSAINYPSPMAITGLAQSGYSSIQNLSTPTVTAPSITGNTGFMGATSPFIVVERPMPHVAENYGNLVGYPSYIYKTLSDLKGYTEIEKIHLDGITGATQTELNEIESLLKQGVVFL